MPVSTSWWTEAKVEETVTAAYVHSHLRAGEQEILSRPIYFGGDLTNCTYLDWILAKTKRLFLILVAAGVPDQIFGVIDDAFDDDDLPVAEAAVAELRLSLEPDQSLNKRFYKAQFKYLARVPEESEHIRYAEEESVPLITTGVKSALFQLKDGVDGVRLPDDNRLLLRRKITLGASTGTNTEQNVLEEIAEMKRFSHQHVLAVFASYTHHGSIYVLSFPAGEYNLKSFLTDQPKSFDNLSKSDRRSTLLNWVHCLAAAVAWLHANGGHHGAIRPSNINVTQNFEVCLGNMDGEGVLCSVSKPDDIESYQYAPPERWKRAVTVQTTGSGKLSMPPGNRHGRKPQGDTLSPLDPSTRRTGPGGRSHSGVASAYSFQSSSKSQFSRLRLSNKPAKNKATVTRSAQRLTHAQSIDSFGIGRGRTELSDDSVRSPSVLSSTSSGRAARSGSTKGVFIAAAPESRTAVVQTWRSVQHDSFAADVFSLAAVSIDILTILCKRTFSAFVRHRSKNNRNAGRGGGLADASFHSNIGQVMTWAQLLAEDAEKKAKKDDAKALAAVGPMLQVVVQGLDRNPEARPKSDVLERRIKDHMARFAGMASLHCISTLPEHRPMSRQDRDSPVDATGATSSRPGAQRPRPQAHGTQTPIQELDEAAIVDLPTPTSDSSTTRATTSHSRNHRRSPPAISLDSFSSLHLSPEARSLQSDTLIAHSRDQSYDSPVSSTTYDSYPPNIRRTHREPRLASPFAAESAHGVSNYMNYSTSPSDDERDRSTYLYPMPPSQPPPRKELPPLPAMSSQSSTRSTTPSRTKPTNTVPAAHHLLPRTRAHQEPQPPETRPMRGSSLVSTVEQEKRRARREARELKAAYLEMEREQAAARRERYTSRGSAMARGVGEGERGW